MTTTIRCDVPDIRVRGTTCVTGVGYLNGKLTHYSNYRTCYELTHFTS